MVQGLRPTEPANASSIRFSDLLWVFVQRCWDGDAKLRPKVTEVVTHLEREATNWHGLMPSCAPAENVSFDSKEPMSDTEDCEFEIPILPLTLPIEQRGRYNLSTIFGCHPGDGLPSGGMPEW